MNDIFKIIGSGLVHFRRKPVFGQQDLGVSPGGPMDRLAVITGNIMLGNSDFAETIEIILPTRLLCMKNTVLVLTGAHRECILEYDDIRVPVAHGQVYFAPEGSTIVLGDYSRGLRTVLSFRNVSSEPGAKKYTGRVRGDFSKKFSFPDQSSAIRVIKGPEHDRLNNRELFLSAPWKISLNSNEMGLRLEHPFSLKLDSYKMISDVVADGTIQLTKKGPIVLLYHRQTIGGYPRIFNVISSDLDSMSQFLPGQYVRFKLISPEEAREINELRKREIDKFRTEFPLE